MTESSAARTRVVMCSALICCLAASGALAAPSDEPGLQGPVTGSRASSSLKVADGIGGGGGSVLTMRRGLGVVFVAGGVAMAMKGFDYRDEADSFYDAYKSATDLAEIEKYYQRTTNRDVKSQVSWALAAAFGITGVRLLLTGHDGASSAPPLSKTLAPRLSLDAAVTPGALGLRLRRPFY